MLPGTRNPSSLRQRRKYDAASQKPETIISQTLFWLVLLLFILAGCSAPVPSDLKPIKILYTGDIDGYIDPCG